MQTLCDCNELEFSFRVYKETLPRTLYKTRVVECTILWNVKYRTILTFGTDGRTHTTWLLEAPKRGVILNDTANVYKWLFDELEIS